MEFPLIIFSIFLLVRFPGEDVSISLGETEGTVLFDSACAATKRAVPPLHAMPQQKGPFPRFTCRFMDASSRFTGIFESRRGDVEKIRKFEIQNGESRESF